MRWTRTFLPTLRNAPAGIESAGHRWMIRAGLGRPAPGDEWNLFPLGVRVRENILRIVRGEWDSLAAVEIRVPDPLAAVPLVGNDLQSWRQFPLLLRQAGEAWSFDLDERERKRSFEKIRVAFLRIFAHTGLEFRAVESVPGEEFHFLSPTGGDSVLACPGCGYAATREKAECPVSTSGGGRLETTELPPTMEVATPGKTTVEEVATFLKVNPREIVKTLIFRTEKGFLGGIVRGDHELNPAKLKRTAGVETLELATPKEIEKTTHGPVGFSGPVGLSIPLYCDRALERMSNLIAGANRADTHLRFVNRERDFRAQAWADLRVARPGEKCPRCREPIEISKGVRLAHLSRWETGSDAKWNHQYVDAKGKSLPIRAASYGISPDRILAATVERHHDEKGISWPEGLAPFPVALVTINPKGDLRLDELSRDIYEDLAAAGVNVFWDDRDLSPGVKFTDADLVGFPVRVVLGKKTTEKGTVDLQELRKPEAKTVPMESVLEAVKNAIQLHTL